MITKFNRAILNRNQLEHTHKNDKKIILNHDVTDELTLFVEKVFVSGRCCCSTYRGDVPLHNSAYEFSTIV